MADKKTTQLVEATELAADDVFLVVDVSAAGPVDVSAPGRGPGGTTKKAPIPLVAAVLPFDPAGAADEAVEAHTEAADPHPQYALESALGTAATRNVGTSAGTVCAGDDSRLSDARTPTAHTHPWSQITSTPTTLAGYGITDGGGGGASDLLSPLTAAEISVTGATTATVGRMHVCSDSGSPANYTLALPSAVGQAGRLIGVRMSTGLTRLVTLDGDDAETIDGAQTRVMWAGESALLLCDGTGWTKIAGRSVPFYCEVAHGGGQPVTGGGFVKVLFGNVVSDAGGIWDAPNYQFGIPRGGIWNFDLKIRSDDGGPSGGTSMGCAVHTELGDGPFFAWGAANPSRNGLFNRRTVRAVTGAIYLAYLYSDGNCTLGNSGNSLVVQETPTW